jgi:hypothetical protein
MHGVVSKIFHDGRVGWLPDGNSMELIALPGNLLNDT